MQFSVIQLLAVVATCSVIVVIVNRFWFQPNSYKLLQPLVSIHSLDEDGIMVGELKQLGSNRFRFLSDGRSNSARSFWLNVQSSYTGDNEFGYVEFGIPLHFEVDENQKYIFVETKTEMTMEESVAGNPRRAEKRIKLTILGVRLFPERIDIRLRASLIESEEILRDDVDFTCSILIDASKFNNLISEPDFPLENGSER